MHGRPQNAAALARRARMKGTLRKRFSAKAPLPDAAAVLQPVTDAYAGQVGRVVVYSCYFGDYEPFNPAATGDGIGYDRVVFSDRTDLAHPGIRFETLDPGGMDARLLSRLPKMRPHVFFDDYDWAVYVDNSATLKMSPLDLLSRILAGHDGLAPAGRYFFPHDSRNCAYREARMCLRLGKMSRPEFVRQIRRFRNEGFPQRFGLYANTLMVQRMGDVLTDTLNDAWYGDFLRRNGRDQVSLPFTLWKYGYPARVLPLAVADVARWPLFGPRQRIRHARQRFRLARRQLRARLRGESAAAA